MTLRGRLLLGVLVAAGSGLAGAAAWILWPLPRDVTAPPATLSLTLEDRNGLPLRTTRTEGGELARWLPLGGVDPQLLQAFIALEDRRFYRHHGVDLTAVGRAIVQNVEGSRVVSGASTITMQLARLLTGGGHGWTAKASQALWALRLERHLDKQQILEQYLNRVPLGQGAVGVAAAAALYFDGSGSRLSLGQAALLAGLASAPSADNPFVAPERARARRALALRRMLALGYVTRDAADRAAVEPVVSARRRPPFLAPHFTSRVLQWAEDSGTALSGRWRTSVDLALQGELEAEVRHTVALLADRGVRQGAAVVLDNATGEILAWVGSPDFWADTAGQVDMVVSPRQPGSALKPFLYALAFDRRWSPASVLPDIARTYQTASGPYQPRNYDRRFHGPVRAREALASSFNVPAIELTDRLGAGALLRVLHEAGFASLDRDAEYYGLGLALGNGDVTLLEMANAYRGLVNGGVLRPYRWDAAAPGEHPFASGGDGRHFVSRASAALVLDILSDPVARVPGFGIETPFDFPFPAAVKTGTSHHFTDNWAVAVTGGFTVAVWVGNFSGRPMRQVSGVTGAGPLLHRSVMDVARRYEAGVLPSPAGAGAVRVAICRLSGARATEHCPGMDEWMPPGAPALPRCDWHRADGFVAWPAQYAEWVAQNGLGRPDAAGEVPEHATALAATARRFRIVSPLDGDRYEVPPGMDPRYATIALRAAGEPDDEPVRWSVDGRAVGTSRWRLRSGTHTIRALGASGRRAEVSIDVR